MSRPEGHRNKQSSLHSCTPLKHCLAWNAVHCTQPYKTSTTNMQLTALVVLRSRMRSEQNLLIHVTPSGTPILPWFKRHVDHAQARTSSKSSSIV